MRIPFARQGWAERYNFCRRGMGDEFMTSKEEQNNPGPASSMDSGPLPAAALTDGGTVINDPKSLSRSLPGRTIGTSDAPMRQVGRYQIIEKLGEGAMASVYKAYDPSIDRQ